jgi:5'-nucleotidase
LAVNANISDPTGSTTRLETSAKSLGVIPSEAKTLVFARYLILQSLRARIMTVELNFGRSLTLKLETRNSKLNMNILVTNDDGIFAPGLEALYRALQQLGSVSVVAPESEQSAVGHSISLATPLRVKQVALPGGLTGWAVSGTPADCVKIALAELLPQPPDLVVSGINLGPNVGINVLYSGTVSAATEAAILGVRGVAFSLNTYKDADFATAASLAGDVLARLQKWPGWTNGVILNVNLPALPREQIRGVKVTRQDTGRMVEHFQRRVDPRERVYYWLAEINERRCPAEETDYCALNEGYISITPIHFDLTHYSSLKALQNHKF